MQAIKQLLDQLMEKVDASDPAQRQEVYEKAYSALENIAARREDSEAYLEAFSPSLNSAIEDIERQYAPVETVAMEAPAEAAIAPTFAPAGEALPEMPATEPPAPEMQAPEMSAVEEIAAPPPEMPEPPVAAIAPPQKSRFWPVLLGLLLAFGGGLALGYWFYNDIKQFANLGAAKPVSAFNPGQVLDVPEGETGTTLAQVKQYAGSTLIVDSGEGRQYSDFSSDLPDAREFNMSFTVNSDPGSQNTARIQLTFTNDARERQRFIFDLKPSDGSISGTGVGADEVMEASEDGGLFRFDRLLQLNDTYSQVRVVIFPSVAGSETGSIVISKINLVPQS